MPTPDLNRTKRFKNRTEAGRLLARALQSYQGQPVAVLALPRGGVVLAVEVARTLNAPLDLIITRKVGHPYQPEYAVAAVSEHSCLLGESVTGAAHDSAWLKEAMASEQQEAKRRRKAYLGPRAAIPVEGKIAIIVDDGVATGLTLRLAIRELKSRQPKMIVVAVPVAPQSVAQQLGAEADRLVALNIPADHAYLGAVGAYYDDFSPVSDEQVVALMQSAPFDFDKG